MSAYQFTAVLFTVSYLLLSVSANQPCSASFKLEAEKRQMEHCQKKTLGAEFGWSYRNATRTLDILFGARLDSETGWLAWGINPENEARMIGTRALIGVKLENETLLNSTYNVTRLTKMGCGLLPSKIDLEILNFRFSYKIELYVIEASIVLPPMYNISKMNLVWQIGEATAGTEPKMHPHKLVNLDSKETMDLISGNVVSNDAHPREKLRRAHGILNIVGWGTLLPIGVIIARYCRKYPLPCSSWFSFHVGSQILGWILGTTGWILGIVLGNSSKHYGFRTHRTLAIIIFTFTTLQMLALRLKPKRRDEYRVHWNMYHHFLGYSLLVIISANIFQGMAILSTQPNWKWAYIGVLGFLGLIALLLECYTWIRFKLEQNTSKKISSSGGDGSQPDDAGPDKTGFASQPGPVPSSGLQT